MDTQKVVNRHKPMGVQGYCMGGPYAFVAASLRPDRVGAAATCHGGGLVTDKPDSPHLLIEKAKAQFYCAVAANDDARQPDAKDKLKAAFDAAKLSATVEVYAGDNHGWCVKDNPTYNAAGAERAWANVTSLYGRVLV
jgi:carboxymethylenebutenolidase